jgi:MerR family mercuric resistance operon transcriptional regulator
MTRAVKIGELARQTGLSIDAIRFYEKEGLLQHPPRSQGGYRLFSSGHVDTLLFIRQAQELGFSLNEIRELLILRDERLHACTHVRELLAQKLGAVREKLAELRALEELLRGALKKCDRKLQADGGPHKECCPVLDEIAQTGKIPPR